jgi:hypothetical protein
MHEATQPASCSVQAVGPNTTHQVSNGCQFEQPTPVRTVKSDGRTSALDTGYRAVFFTVVSLLTVLGKKKWSFTSRWL